MSTEPDKPLIEYPCIWSYKLICAAATETHRLVESILGEREFTLVPSQSSSLGKYESHDLSVVAMSDDDRLSIFDKFKKTAAVKFLL